MTTETDSLGKADEDGDDVSITSSIIEDWDEDQDWDVDDILAEGIIGGEVKYLTQWTGYPLADAGWEPRKNLMTETVKDWKEQKRLQKSGALKKFDLTLWQQARLDKIRGKIARHNERNAKRRRLGLAPTELPSSYPYELQHMAQPLSTWIHPTEEFDSNNGDDDDSPMSLFESDGQEQDVLPTGLQGHGQFRIKGAAKAREASALDHSSSSTTMERRASTSDIDKQSIKLLPNLRPGKSRFPRSHTSPTTSAASNMIPGPGKPSQAAIGNVFTGGKVRKARRTLGQNETDGGTAMKQLSYRRANLLNKRSRDRENAAPAQMPKNLISLNHNQPTAPKPATDNNVQSVDDKAQDLSTKEIHDQPESVAAQSKKKEDDTTGLQTSAGGRVAAPSSLRESASNPRGLKKRKSVTWRETPEIHEFDPAMPDNDSSLEPLADSEPSLFVQSQTTEEDADVEVITTKFPKVTAAFRPPSPPRGAKHSLAKPCLLGPEATSKIDMTFEWTQMGDIGSWYTEFERQPTVTFTHTCLGLDVTSREQVLSGMSQNVLIIGEVSCSFDDRDKAESASKKLKLVGGGVICHHELYCILAFPTKCEQWEGLESSLGIRGQNAKGNPFYCCIFKPWPGIDPWLLPSTDPSREPLIDKAIPSGLNRLLQLDCAGLLPFPCPKKDLSKLEECSYFLMFPQAGLVEAKSLAQWIVMSMKEVPKCRVFDSFVPGGWDEFCEVTKRRGNGVVIIDEDAVGHLRLIPRLSDILKVSPGIRTFWIFQRSLEAWRRYPPEEPMPSIGDLNFAPVLTSGRMFLLTPSFMHSEPQKLHAFLKFFWKYCTNPMHPRLFGKLVLPANYECFMSELNRTHMAGDVFSSKDAEASVKAWDYLARIQNPWGESPGEEFLVIAPESIDPFDEQSLVNWFGWWSLQNLDQYSCAYVIGSSRFMRDERMSARVATPAWDIAVQQNADAARESERWMTHELDMRNEASSKPPTGPNMTIVRPAELMDRLRQLWIHNKGRKGVVMTLYIFPVAYWDTDMAIQMGDIRSEYKTYKDWFKFTLPLTLVHQRRTTNTVAGFFYTITTKWKPGMQVDKDAPRRPWLAFFRPVNPHMERWSATELFIWDSAYRGQVIEDASELIPAQRELINHVKEANKLKNPDQLLNRVWIGGNQSNNHPDMSLYHRALSYLEYLSEDVRECLPPSLPELREQGWSMIRFGCKKIGSHQEADVEPAPAPAPKSVAHRAVFYPPRAYGYSNPAQAVNFFWKHSVNARWRGEETSFVLGLSSTMSWYGMQQREGRDFSHITVEPWPTIFKELGIPESGEDTGIDE